MIRTVARTIGSDSGPTTGVAMDCCHRTEPHGSRTQYGPRMLKGSGCRWQKIRIGIDSRTLRAALVFIGGGVKGTLCGGGWVSETRGGSLATSQCLTTCRMATRRIFSAGANAPGWVVPLPMSDSNLSPVAGSRVKSSATGRLGQLWQEEEHGVPNAGNGRDMGVCCASSVGSSGHRQIACLLLRDHLRSRAQKGDADAGFMAAIHGSGHRKRCGLGFGSEESSRTAETTGQGVRGENAEKVTPPRPPTSSRRLDFFATPCRPGLPLSPLLPSRHADGVRA